MKLKCNRNYNTESFIKQKVQYSSQQALYIIQTKGKIGNETKTNSNN